MVSVNPIDVSEWLLIFRPVKRQLRDALKEILQDENGDETEKMHATIYLVDYVSESPDELVGLVQEAGAKEFPLVFPEIERRRKQTLATLERAIRDDDRTRSASEAEKDHLAEREARAAVALFRLGSSDQVWPLLAHRSDPRIRSFLIHWLARLGDDPGTMQACLQKIEGIAHAPAAAGKPAQQKSANDPNRSALFDPDTSIRRAQILIVGHFDPAHLSAADRAQAIQKLLETYRDDPDPGIHGAICFTLRRFGQGEQLRLIDVALSQVKETGNRRWSVNSAGQTMVNIDGPLQFRMGATEKGDEFQNERQHERRIPRRFAIAATEVSVGEFAEFWKLHSGSFPGAQLAARSADLPRGDVTWYMAAAYCNWLSEKEGKDPVYATNTRGQFAMGMRVKEKEFDGGGYRLPTEAEWEYACRAGAETNRYFGNSWRLLRQYARLTSWEEVSLLHCASLLPNDFGLFDMLGNVMEWCHDADYDYEDFASGKLSDYLFKDVIDSHYRVMRGGSYLNRPPDAHSAVRAKYDPDLPHFCNGFRVARTLR
jgi:formylglycine-generating enzyme required for sulfatase activity